MYARYTRLCFDRPHPKVPRITTDNGRMNTADDAMDAELADMAVITGAGKCPRLTAILQ
jgi:hypothetical protein